MPNHITNIILTKGLNLDKYITEYETKSGVEKHLDFNKIVPFPEELEGITSPIIITEDQDEMDESFKIYQEFTKNGSNGFPPIVCITRVYSNLLKEKFGFDNWYDWCCNNWGTKWNSYNTVFKDGALEKFETAWSTPRGVFLELSKLEKTTISVMWKDEGDDCIQISVYNNGNLVSETPVGSFHLNTDEVEGDSIDDEEVRKYIVSYII